MLRDYVTATNLGIFLFGVTLAFGFTLSASIVSRAALKMRQDGSIKVKGYATRAVSADAAAWSCEVSAKARDLPTAYALLARYRDAVGNALVAGGLALEEIEVMPVRSSAEHRLDERGNRTNSIENLVLTQELRVRTPRVALVDRLSKRVTDLLQAGVPVSSGTAEYTDTGLDAIKLELLRDATANGFRRATLLAEASGGRVGELCAASQGVFQVTAAGSTEVSDYGRYDTSTIAKTVTAVVTLEYTIAR